ncbi:hypothetical protein M5689_002181 [Euphorbia peplus]|nr:hypothetical protein M5689_002181 [Euphorbia peplus]
MSLNSLQVDKRVGIKDADGAIRGGREEVSGEREGGWPEEGKGGDGGGMMVHSAERGGGGDVVDMDCVVGAIDMIIITQTIRN